MKGARRIAVAKQVQGALETLGVRAQLAAPAFGDVEGNVADVITRAGFPPVHLTEVNFQAMFEQQQAQLQQESAQPSPIITTA